jgi:predicted nucleotidyltransferase
MSAVPLNSIIIHFKPEEKIHRESKVSIENFGITGSILLDIHQEFSDIDLLVYGKENSLLARDSLLQLYEKSDSNFNRFNKETHDSWCERKIRQYGISLREAEELYKRKWGIGVFEDKRFSINPVKQETEVLEKYGDRIYFPKGMIKLEATVSDGSDAVFLPSTYGLENVRLINGFSKKEIREVTCYDGFYSDIARDGERIIVYGKLEKIHDKILGIDYYRVLVGSPEAEGKDYIKLVTN